MSTLSTRAQELFDVARRALPSWLFSQDETAELVAQSARALASVWGQIDYYIDQVFILRAGSAFLDELAKDKGTRRQENETDAALSTRLRQVDDMITLAAIRAHVLALLVVSGVTVPAGYPGLVELRQRRAFYTAGRGVQMDCVAVASLIDGETFVIGGITYEFDKNGTGVSPGNVRVDVSTLTTATQVATAVAALLEVRYPGEVFTSTSHVVVRSVEGPVSEAVANTGFALFRRKAYFTRGFRMGFAYHDLIVILPYGTDAATQQSIEEALRQIKAGGVNVVVERRLSP